MDELKDKIRSKQNLFDTIIRHIPGFGGYLRKEDRRETDKILREHLAVKMEQIRKRLDPITQELTDSGGLAFLSQIDRIRKGLEKIISRLRYAVYGYSGFFDIEKVDEKELDRLYKFDVDLVERIDGLEQAVAGLQAAVSEPQTLKTVSDDTMKLIREFDEHFDERTHMIAPQKKE